ncbi:IS110 family transposase [Sinorhizobium meliloti]|uniref:IS110 family transposase n=1 Tax=Rhizobium meliloti TaxID=382 RepID=UPI001F30C1CF|nr:IS110 family transposase [Sinorhizobium meliloti]
MKIFVGLDVAKDLHWAYVIDSDAKPVLSHSVANDPDQIAALITEIEALGADEVTVALDLLGGTATLLCAMIAEAGLRLVHTPGLSVNRARQGMRGGENKSDPRDAATIAELARTRPDLRPVETEREIDVDIRLLVGRRSEIVRDQTRRLGRLRDLLSSLFPAFERQIDVKTKTGLTFLSHFAAPHELRTARAARIARKLMRSSPHLRGVLQLAEEAIMLAKAQSLDVPGATTRARLIKELAAEALAARQARDRIDSDIAELLARHPDAALVQSLPGMGVVMTAELIAHIGDIRRFRSADALAAAAGLTPVLRQSGKSYAIRRATSGDKALKRVFFQSAFAALSHPGSKAFYNRKRTEGKRHSQALIALAEDASTLFGQCLIRGSHSSKTSKMSLD